MKRVVIGVIGHVDHGKTALVQALSGQDTDRLPEEKERGISIALGFAHFRPAPDVEIDLIDMPGHERFVRTMISGATGIDAVLLVVAANEGIQPQTVEHVEIADLLGIGKAVVAISKCDLVTLEQAQQVADETMLLLARSGILAAPGILTSAPQCTGIEQLRQALTALGEGQQLRPGSGLAFLPIDRAFSMTGHGPVVTGTLRGAAIGTGDMLDLLPLRRRVRVRGVQVHGEAVQAGVPGQRVALNLRNVEVSELERGMVLAVPDTLAPSQWLTISLRAVAGAPPLRNGMRVRALFGTDEVDARLRLLDRNVLEPGQAGFAQLNLDELVTLPAREHVIIRVHSPAQTLAGGRVLETNNRRLRRNSPRILRRLEELNTLSPAAMIVAEVERAGAAGITIQQLSQISALAPARVHELLEPHPFVVTRSGLVLPKADMDSLLTRIPSLLAPHADGLSQDSMQSALPGAGVVVLDEVVGELLARKIIRKDGSHLTIPRPDQDRARAEGEMALTARIANTLLAAGLAPPKPSELIVDSQTRRVVDRLLRDGVLVRAVDRAKRKEIIFHRDAVEEAKRLLAPLLERGAGLLVTEIGATLKISRKYSMPLLDYLDTIRFTRRVGDRRQLWSTSSSSGMTS